MEARGGGLFVFAVARAADAVTEGSGLPGREAEAPNRGTGTREGDPKIGLPGLLSRAALVDGAAFPAGDFGTGRLFAACIACSGIVDLVIFDCSGSRFAASPEDVDALVGEPRTEAIEARFDIFLGAGLGLACVCCDPVCNIATPRLAGLWPTAEDAFAALAFALMAAWFCWILL